jgi:hypothetical protein
MAVHLRRKWKSTYSSINYKVGASSSKSRSLIAEFQRNNDDDNNNNNYYYSPVTCGITERETIRTVVPISKNRKC